MPGPKQVLSNQMLTSPSCRLVSGALLSVVVALAAVALAAGSQGDTEAAEPFIRTTLRLTSREAGSLEQGQAVAKTFPASLKREVLDLNSHFPPPTEYLRQGWRSLSLVGPTFARVLFAHPGAPDFLRTNLGRSVVFDVGISL